MSGEEDATGETQVLDHALEIMFERPRSDDHQARAERIRKLLEGSNEKGVILLRLELANRQDSMRRAAPSSPPRR